MKVTTVTPLCSTLLTVVLTLTGASVQAARDLTVHEWGTFTSIQGGNGELLYWSAVETSELPEFVYNWSRPGLGRRLLTQQPGPSKQSFPALQRMETPVIYFYTEQRLRAEVTVKFPRGIITEWFPQAAEVGPSMRTPNASLVKLDQWLAHSRVNVPFSFVNTFGPKPTTTSVIRWRDIGIVPSEPNHTPRIHPPLDGSHNHYYTARNTDAALVRIRPLDAGHPTPELEKFLFYRGVGQFQTPLEVTIEGKLFALHNVGAETLPSLFLLSVRDDGASFVPIRPLAAGGICRIDMDRNQDALPIDRLSDRTAGLLTHALVSQGLYAREAAAMVGTWQDSWFKEPGVRILYILPRQWTDAILPMEITPVPRDLVRVMVGRAELITPTLEEQVRECVSLFERRDEASRTTALRQFDSLALGRFTAPAIGLVIRQSTDTAFSRSAMDLLQAVTDSSARTVADAPAQSAAGRSTSTGR